MTFDFLHRKLANLSDTEVGRLPSDVNKISMPNVALKLTDNYDTMFCVSG